MVARSEREQSGLSYTFPATSVSTGTHDVQLIARDIFGQEMLTPDSQVKVDGTRPRVRISRRGQSLIVQVGDTGSGLIPGSVHVSFGDGAHAAKKPQRRPPLRARRDVHRLRHGARPRRQPCFRQTEGARMSLRAKLVALCVLVLPTLGQAGVARADVFGTISLLSASPFGQAEYAHDPALSEDGRYVVFDGAIAGVQGVWRREARPGANFEQVAGGDADAAVGQRRRSAT